jgi:hypothetical protein
MGLCRCVARLLFCHDRHHRIRGEQKRENQRGRIEDFRQPSSTERSRRVMSAQRYCTTPDMRKGQVAPSARILMRRRNMSARPLAFLPSLDVML